jgi:environmental stress-induced protein Ves
VILRAADRIAVPWKNGAGLTREVAVHPPGSTLVNFAWRVSLAEVRTGGPFSTFTGIDRQMAVLSGRLQLSIAGRKPLTLCADSDPVAFAGELPVSSEPVQSPVLDLNVMTRRAAFAARLRRCRARSTATVALEADSTLLLALAPLTLHAPRMQETLASLDAVHLSRDRHTRVEVPIEGAALDFWLIEISAAAA